MTHVDSTPTVAELPARSAAVLAILVAIALVVTLLSFLPPVAAAVLVGVLAWFSMPGILLARRLYGSWATAALAGPIWGYVLSSLVLLGLWAAGVRSFGWLVLAPVPAAAIAWLAGGATHGLTAPRMTRRDAGAAMFVLLAALAIVGRPYARVGEMLPEGRAYRAYFTADFVWAMAVVSEVSKGDVPPRNPYYLDDELHYYWLMHLLPAVEHRAGVAGASIDQLLLMNALWTGLAFSGFFYWFVRHFVERPWAAATACVFVLCCSSFEGADRLWSIWQRGSSYDELRVLNIDAVVSWVYHGMKVDGLQRLLLYQPQHQVGYVLGFSALLLLAQARDCGRAGLMLLAGAFLGGSLLFSSFAAGMLGIATALYAAYRLVLARQWVSLLTGGIAGVVLPAGALLLGNALRYVDTTPGGNPLAVVGLNPLAVQRVWWSFFLNFGPVLMVAVVGLLAALVSSGRRARVMPAAVVLAVSTAFYFFVDVPDHDGVYVAWRASHLAFIALAPLCGWAFQLFWERGGIGRWAMVVATLLIGTAAVPTVAIDIFNSQDLDNRAMGPGFRWTVILNHGELEGLEWIKRNTRPDERVQVEPVVRQRDTWAYIPAFADRRMSAGVPIGMIPLAKYEAASAEMVALYNAASANRAHEIAVDRCIDYLVIGEPERRGYPALQSLLDEKPYLFTPAFRNDAMTIYMVRGPHPDRCLG